MNTHQHTGEPNDLWADERDEHTDDMSADPADILAEREEREGVNILGMPIDNNTH